MDSSTRHRQVGRRVLIAAALVVVWCVGAPTTDPGRAAAATTRVSSAPIAVVSGQGTAIDRGGAEPGATRDRESRESDASSMQATSRSTDVLGVLLWVGIVLGAAALLVFSPRLRQYRREEA